MFTVLEAYPFDQLEQQIRAVPLLQRREGELVYPYEHADITLESIPYVGVRPTSRYVVTDNLDRQRKLAQDLHVQGYDPLRLSGSLLLQSSTAEAPVGLIPPIVEETDANGLYMIDGMHRSYIGWQSGRIALTVVRVRGIRVDCPAAALPNEWTDIIEYPRVPSDVRLKRDYRDDHLAYRRDFSRLNGSQPRN